MAWALPPAWWDLASALVAVIGTPTPCAEGGALADSGIARVVVLSGLGTARTAFADAGSAKLSENGL